MVGFSEAQTKALAAKLPERHVRTREQDGRTLYYIEGWHAIAEANRIFGFDAWDRRTLEMNCLGQKSSEGHFGVSYMARVGISVRAGAVIVMREATGTGHGWAAMAGEAHEIAMKSAETDAMKRALTTFGNPFGLALYDSEHRGVRATPKPRAAGTCQAPYELLGPDGCEIERFNAPEPYCSALKKQLRGASTIEELEALWTRNNEVRERLRLAHPELKTEGAVHYVDVLAALFRERKAAMNAKVDAAADDAPSALAISRGAPRLRDATHLRRVATQPCLVCGRHPGEAHHLRFAVPSTMGRKPGDQLTVPLCRIHHQELHTQGNEEVWWRDREIDPIAEAERLWAETHGLGKAS